MELVSNVACFGGEQRRYRHRSTVLNCDMHFSLYLPPQWQQARLGVFYWLSGLTCTDENFVTKAGAQRRAAELGIAILCPDTSPRGEGIADADGYDLGQGAGFYVNATQAPWAGHFRMYDYVVDELPAALSEVFPNLGDWGIAGHSMGGHGALSIGLRHPERFAAISAFAPIVNPVACPWGQKALGAYLGNDKNLWQAHDSCQLMEHFDGHPLPVLVDQGLGDQFLQSQMLTRPLEQVSQQVGYPAEFHYHPNYDHSYFFIASFIDRHLDFHHNYFQR